MKIVIAPDSFKGSMTATQVCQSMEIGARRVFPDAEIIGVPLADGGEGTLDAFASTYDTIIKTQRVRGPLGAPVEARWGILTGDGRAIIEMAQASGLNLVSTHQRDALRACSFGTGQLIKAALDAGCREIVVALGGSATTDAGVGALSALGLFARDANQRILPAGGAALQELDSLDLKFLDTRLNRAHFTVLSDVDNPLYGPNGAALIYAAQKGASNAEIVQLNKALKKFADVCKITLKCDYAHQPGAGAAGGLGFAMLAFCNAKLQSGIDAVLAATGLHQKIGEADFILTGEGRIDAQTLDGKTIKGVCNLARQHSIPVIGFAGKVQLNQQQLRELGLTAAFSLVDQQNTLESCISNGFNVLAQKVENFLRTA